MAEDYDELRAQREQIEQHSDEHRLRRIEHKINQLTELVKQGFDAVIAELETLKPPTIFVVVAGRSIHIPGLTAFQGENMSTYSGIPRDHQDEPFTLDPIVISDSEGPVDIPVTEALASDNPDVVSIVGDAPNQSFHFGTFGTATVSRKATFTPPGEAETTVNAGTAVFNLTPGALTVSGDIKVPGLTPDPVS